MTTKRRESCDTTYRRACRLIGTGWPSAQLNDELKEFVSITFSLSTKTLESDIASEMKKMKPAAAAMDCGHPDCSVSGCTQAPPRTCKQCGNPLMDGKCKFINHRS